MCDPSVCYENTTIPSIIIGKFSHVVLFVKPNVVDTTEQTRSMIFYGVFSKGCAFESHELLSTEHPSLYALRL